MTRREPATQATLALARAGVAFTSHSYAHDPRATSYGAEAAAALGLSSAEVFKTLVVTVDGTPVVAVVPVGGSLDLKALATVAGGRRADLADAAVVQRLTGYVLGGVSPIGQKRALPTFVDASARALASVYVSGGRRGFDIALAPDDLLRVTGGTYARIGRPD